jgi:hypothetical protein
MVGSSALEVRLTNGSAAAFVESDGTGSTSPSTSEPVATPIVPLEAPSLKKLEEDANERIVEIFRSSNAHAKSLTRLAKQLEELRDNGTVDEDPAEAEKWARATCPECGRALPENSKVCPFCVNKLRALKRLFGYLGPYKWVAVLNFVLSVVDRGLQFVGPVVFAYLLDYVLVPGRVAPDSFLSSIVPLNDRPRALGILVCIIIATSVVNAGVSIARGRAVAFLGGRVLHDIPLATLRAPAAPFAGLLRQARGRSRHEPRPERRGHDPELPAQRR